MTRTELDLHGHGLGSESEYDNTMNTFDIRTKIKFIKKERSVTLDNGITKTSQSESILVTFTP